MANTVTSGLTQLSGDPAVRMVFEHSLRWSFVGVVALAALTFVASLLIPIGERPQEFASRMTSQAR